MITVAADVTVDSLWLALLLGFAAGAITILVGTNIRADRPKQRTDHICVSLNRPSPTFGFRLLGFHLLC